MVSRSEVAAGGGLTCAKPAFFAADPLSWGRLRKLQCRDALQQLRKKAGSNASESPLQHVVRCIRTHAEIVRTQHLVARRFGSVSGPDPATAHAAAGANCRCRTENNRNGRDLSARRGSISGSAERVSSAQTPHAPGAASDHRRCSKWWSLPVPKLMPPRESEISGVRRLQPVQAPSDGEAHLQPRLEPRIQLRRQQQPVEHFQSLVVGFALGPRVVVGYAQQAGHRQAVTPHRPCQWSSSASRNTP